MNNHSTRSCRKAARRDGFSIASIMLLTCLAAVVLAALRMGIVGDDRLDEEFMAVCSVGGSIVGGLVGVGIGLSQLKWIRGALLGACAGVFWGATAGALLATPRGLPAIVVGSLVLVVFGGVVRFFSKGPPAEKWP